MSDDQRNLSALALSDESIAHADTAVKALEALLDTLAKADHPQEFGMDGCPGCKALNAIKDTSNELREAMKWLLLWQPEARQEAANV